MLLTKLFTPRQIVRCIFTGTVKYKHDPGIRHRQKLLKIETEESDEFDFEDVESDFMEVHKSHKEVEHEEFVNKEKLKSHIIKRKYFSEEKMPNFLTWHDKQQIRHLYNSDPEEWTVEKLSESFPALPDVIHKIVTSNWTKVKENKIRNHDVAVQNNWAMFKEDKLENLPEHLREHLKKFTNRALNFKPFEMTKQPAVVPNVNGEFYKIFSSYQKLKKSEPENLEICEKFVNQKMPKPKLDESNLYANPNQVQLTLSELQKNVQRKLESGHRIDETEKLIVMKKISHDLQKQEENKPIDSFNQVVDLVEKKYETAVGSTRSKSVRDYSQLLYPEKINIPKKHKKKGLTYKLNDCYYDDNGEFLYRVPGMI